MPLVGNPSLFKLPVSSPAGNAVAVVSGRLAGGEIVTVDYSLSIQCAESVYVDCTQSSAGIQIDFPDTGRSLVVPPGCEICAYTYSASSTARITNLDTVNPYLIRVMFFACHQPLFERYPGTGVLRAYGVAQPRGTLSQTAVYTNPGSYVPPLGASWDNPVSGNGSVTLSPDYLSATITTYGANSLGVRTVDSVTVGKWYWEMQGTGQYANNGDSYMGMCNDAFVQLTQNQPPLSSNIFYQFAVGRVFGTASTDGNIPASTGFTVGFAFDAGAGRLWIRPDPTAAWNGNAAYTPTDSSNAGGGYLFNAAAGSPAKWHIATLIDNNSANHPAIQLHTGQKTGTGAGFLGVVPTGYTPGFPIGAYSG